MEETGKTGTCLARMSMRVAQADVDGARIIYFAAPFTWSERLYSSWMAESVRPLLDLFTEGHGTPIVTTGAEYRSSLKQDELIEVELYAERVGNTSFTLRTDIFKPGEPPAISVRTTHVYVFGLDTEMVPSPVPEWLREALGTSPVPTP